jgi:hypothetical protein
MSSIAAIPGSKSSLEEMAEALLLASLFEYDLLAVPQQCDRLSGEGTTNACESLKMSDPSKKNTFIEGEGTILVASLRRRISSTFESEVQADALAVGDRFVDGGRNDNN